MESTHGIKFKDKVGYALGDTAGLLTNAVVTTFQMKFYTDFLGMTGGYAAILLLIARIWDAINDPVWGSFVDSRKPTKHGRFRPYILGAAIPYAIASVLMFAPFLKNGNPTTVVILAAVTYIFYGMMYTGTNIPYGSLASVITDDEIERSSLSLWRSIGAGLGGLPGQIILPMIVYSVNKDTGVKSFDGNKLFIAVILLSVFSALTYFIHFRMTKERVTVSAAQKSGNYNFFRTLKDLVRNKEFIVVSIVSMLLIAYQYYTQTCYNYLFDNVYGNGGLYTFVTVCTYLPMAMFIPFMAKLIRRFGKKEICSAGLAFSALANLIAFGIRGTSLAANPYVFLVACFLSGAGMTFLVLEVWAIVMDVIDYHELRTGRHEEGTCFSVFTFMRKLGQTLAGTGTAVLIEKIGYDSELASSGIRQSGAVLSKIYDISTLVPAITLLIMFVTLAFGYKFGKKNLEVMHQELNAHRAAEKQKPAEN